jgi:hypothetical protein
VCCGQPEASTIPTADDRANAPDRDIDTASQFAPLPLDSLDDLG